MINLIKTTLTNNDPLILTITFFCTLAMINTMIVLVKTLLEKKKENSDKTYLLTLILIATISMTTILITTYIK